MEDIGAYLRRIGFHGEIRHDLATLKALINAHWLNLPYENLDTVMQNKFDIKVWETIICIKI